jgi:hypothetical protein
MLDKLFDLVKGLAGDSVINNPDVPNEQNNAVIAEATHTVANGLQDTVAGGGLQHLLSMFGGGTAGISGGQGLLSNPMVGNMISQFSGTLMSKFGLGSTQAGNVANSLIPNVMNGLVNRTNDPNDSNFTLDKLLHSITGGQSTAVAQEQQANGNTGFSFQNLIGQFTGGGQQSGGGLTDLVSRIAGGAQNQQQQAGGGGLMDMIKGFL